MSYSPLTDFIALLRLTGGGVRTERMPGLDYVVSALARAGLINLSVSLTAPTSNQATTAWFRPSVPSWTTEGTLFLWNPATVAYEVATPALWFLTLSSATVEVVQDVTTVGPVLVQVNATVVRVQNVGAPVALTLPLSATKQKPVLISDWANHAGTTGLITISTSGGEIFPGGGTTWQIGADAGSVFLRPVPGGYAL